MPRIDEARMMTPRQLGRFEIRGELGRGAQSTVYLAWDPQLGREVALKTLEASAADPVAQVELLHEARATSRLNHPNIVTIYDVGVHAGTPFLVLERVEGCSLTARLAAEGPLLPHVAATLMRDIAAALAHAHAAGIIHRDLKPANILIDARDGRPRVMDFGIAVQLSAVLPVSQEGAGWSGSPAYFAPEYILRREVGPQNDVFAAGLILLEMITGQRVFTADSLPALLERISRTPVSLPAAPPIDAGLAGIILRACAFERHARYANGAELRDALSAWLDSLPAAAEPREGTGQRATLEFLLRRMRLKTDFPALSETVATINRIASAEQTSAAKLAETILKDFALTNKILRLVNAAYYRQAGGGSISTVSRAVIVLGFDALRNIALTVLLFEHLQDKANARALKESFLRASLAGLLARAVSPVAPLIRQREEAYIAALFHRLGHLLAQYYFPEEVAAIDKQVASRHLPEKTAALQVLGISYEELGIGVATRWGFPHALVESMRPLPEGEVPRPLSAEGALRVVAGFANEACDALAATPPAECGTALSRLARRFAASLQLGEQALAKYIEQALQELTTIATILHLDLGQSPFARQAASLVRMRAAMAPVGADEATGGSRPAAAAWVAETLLDDAFHDAGRSEAVAQDAQAVLSAGIQDISQALVEDFSLSDILHIIMETMYRAMGFDRVLLALRDAKSDTMAGRFGLGRDVEGLVRYFRFALAGELRDVFQLAASKGLDVIISDIDDPKIADKVPAWYRAHFSAKTFVLFPLNLRGKSVALIYCDKAHAGAIVIPDKVLALLKTLRNQALLALKHKR